MRELWRDGRMGQIVKLEPHDRETADGSSVHKSRIGQMLSKIEFGC